jgi:transcriptional regulator with XRE-family HTH domain
MVLWAEETTLIEPKLRKPKSGGPYIMNTNEMLEIPVERNLSLEGKLDRSRKTLPYQIEYVRGNYADELWQAMEHRNLNQVKFANRAGVSKQFLTKVFRGENCTIGTMVKLAFALNYKLNVHLTPNEVGCIWMHYMDNWPEMSPRPPQQFINLLTEPGYKPMEVMIEPEPNCEKIAA